MVRPTRRPGCGQDGNRPGPAGAGKPVRVKSVGAGVFEYRIAFGPGYRIYFGWDGDALVILLGGGAKQRQQQDIETARDRWRDYKRRKRREA